MTAKSQPLHIHVRVEGHFPCDIFWYPVDFTHTRSSHLLPSKGWKWFFCFFNNIARLNLSYVSFCWQRQVLTYLLFWYLKLACPYNPVWVIKSLYNCLYTVLYTAFYIVSNSHKNCVDQSEATLLTTQFTKLLVNKKVQSNVIWPSQFRWTKNNVLFVLANQQSVYSDINAAYSNICEGETSICLSW